MKRPPLIVVASLALAAVIALAGCGGGDEEGTGTTDFFDTGAFPGIETDFLPPAEEEPPPAEEPPAADPEIIQLTVPAAGEAIGPQSPSERIAEVQRALVALGFKIGKADGVFGAKTANAIKRFQKNHRLEADGIVGPRTARAINRELRERAAG